MPGTGLVAQYPAPRPWASDDTACSKAVGEVRRLGIGDPVAVDPVEPGERIASNTGPLSLLRHAVAGTGAMSYGSWLPLDRMHHELRLSADVAAERNEAETAGEWYEEAAARNLN
jgi:hypothetical protein